MGVAFVDNNKKNMGKKTRKLVSKTMQNTITGPSTGAVIVTAPRDRNIKSLIRSVRCRSVGELRPQIGVSCPRDIQHD